MLQCTSLNDEIDAVKLLISKGCDIKDYCYACHYAASKNNYKVLEVLLKQGADVNGRDYSGRTPAHWAAQEGCLESLNVLSDYHANFNLINEDEETPLSIAAADPLYIAKHLEIVKFLISKKVDIDSELDTTPFMGACAWENYEVANELLKAGADINHKDSEGRTALFYAKVKRNIKMQEFLLLNGAFLDITDNFGISIKDLDNEETRKKLFDELY